jgi:large repetitive protein
VPAVTDWDEDGRKDLICGGSDGRLHYLHNEGTDSVPDFQIHLYLDESGQTLIVPWGKSSPVITDIDDDGAKDFITGNGFGEVLFYRNIGTNAAPVFSGYVAIESDGVPIVMPSPGNSRPALCDWTGDGLPDLLLGGGTFKVHLYQGVERIRFLCFGDGGGTPCPCGNPGGSWAGCANSTGSGAVLGAAGSTDVSAADLILQATGMIPGKAGLFFQGTNATNGGHGITFGDGLRCTGGKVARLEVVLPNGSGGAGTTVDIALKGSVVAGDLRFYQLWYRDPAGGPCGSGFNTSNAVEVQWLP